MFLHIGTSYNYQLDPELLNAPGSVFMAVGQVIRNTGNLGLLWVAEAAVALLIIGALVALHNVAHRSSDASD